MKYMRKAQDTLSAIEIDKGDVLCFEMRNGSVRVIEILDCRADVLETSLADTKVEEKTGGTTIYFACDVKVDGHPFTMERFLCTQESFYEPYVINGMRLWPDAVSCVFDIIAENHGKCRPKKDVRLAFNDAAESICPEPVLPWCPLEGNTIDVAGTYSGDDCWMGAYLGASAHGGLDINHAAGTPLYMPIDIDFGYLFNSLEHGDNNNRWRGLRRWPNGDVWIIQVHHLIRMRVPTEIPIKSGELMADAAGVYVGSHQHSHFVFAVVHDGEKILLDPFILFREMFELLNDRKNGIKAVITASAAPARTGEPVRFSSEGSRPGPDGTGLKYRWCFGDGATSVLAHPSHAYMKAGIFPVTLTVEDGTERASRSYIITVDGESIADTIWKVEAGDLPQFDLRRCSVCDMYGTEPAFMPHTVPFVFFSGSPSTQTRSVVVDGISAERLECSVNTHGLPVGTCICEAGGGARIDISISPEGLPKGRHACRLRVSCKDDPARIEVVDIAIDIRNGEAEGSALVGIGDEGFYCTPYFWVGHRFFNWPDPRGINGFYLVNGKRQVRGEYAMFVPYIKEGTYDISLCRESPRDGGSEYDIEVKHGEGFTEVRMRPSDDLYLGRFQLSGYCRDYVRIKAENSLGQIYIDAVSFLPVNPRL